MLGYHLNRSRDDYIKINFNKGLVSSFFYTLGVNNNPMRTFSLIVTYAETIRKMDNKLFSFFIHKNIINNVF